MLVLTMNEGQWIRIGKDVYIGYTNRKNHTQVKIAIDTGEEFLDVVRTGYIGPKGYVVPGYEKRARNGEGVTLNRPDRSNAGRRGPSDAKS